MDWSNPAPRWEQEKRPTDHFRRIVFSWHTLDLSVVCIGYLGVALLALWLLYAWPHPYLPTSAALSGLAAAGVAVVSWAYQSGNMRLGVADLFAGEILTLCRVAAIWELVPTLIEQCKGSQASFPEHHASTAQQDYFQIYSSCVKDLEALDGRVAESVTGAYTYFKVLRDKLERLSVPPPSADARERFTLDVVYTAFLTFESAREALMTLLASCDRRPSREDAVSIALANELPAYVYLYNERSRLDPVRRKRIADRFGRYGALISEIAPPQQRLDPEDLRFQLLKVWNALSVQAETAKAA